MKVNPIGIQSYQQLTRQNRPDLPVRPDQQNGQIGQEIQISPQPTVEKPGLAVKGPSGDYSKYLSVEEKQALEQVFANYRNVAKTGNHGTDCGNESNLGRTVDIKV